MRSRRPSMGILSPFLEELAGGPPEPAGTWGLSGFPEGGVGGGSAEPPQSTEPLLPAGRRPTWAVGSGSPAGRRLGSADDHWDARNRLLPGRREGARVLRRRAEPALGRRGRRLAHLRAAACRAGRSSGRRRRPP